MKKFDRRRILQNMFWRGILQDRICRRSILQDRFYKPDMFQDTFFYEVYRFYTRELRVYKNGFCRRGMHQDRFYKPVMFQGTFFDEAYRFYRGELFKNRFCRRGILQDRFYWRGILQNNAYIPDQALATCYQFGEGAGLDWQLGRILTAFWDTSTYWHIYFTYVTSHSNHIIVSIKYMNSKPSTQNFPSPGPNKRFP